MIINPQVPLHRLVLSLSEALDHVSPSVANHQLRVAYMSTRLARVLGYSGSGLRDVFHAAALHDIGLVKARNRIRAIGHNRLEGLEWHSEAGYLLLRDDPFFGTAAPIVRYHHAQWGSASHHDPDKAEIPVASYLVALADTVDRLLRRDAPVLRQAEDIAKRVCDGRAGRFAPECIDAFQAVAESPAFWLDATSPRLYAILSREVDWPALVVDETAVEGVARIFGRVIDSLSPWTGVHSAGVAAVAVALSGYFDFSPREQALLRAAGYLHDLGKIATPGEILDKPGVLNGEERAVLKEHAYYTFRVLDSIGGMPQITEWAAFHHERLDGQGYPFRHTAKDLTVGTRIMAVADMFTAVTEDRPYRAALSEEEALKALQDRVRDGGLDRRVVSTLRAHFQTVNTRRREEQAAWAIGQEVLDDLVQRASFGRGLARVATS